MIMIISLQRAFSFAVTVTTTLAFLISSEVNAFCPFSRPSSHTGPPSQTQSTRPYHICPRPLIFAPIVHSIDSSSRVFSKAVESKEIEESETENTKIPITLLAGFLGSGKTTTLTNLLTNNEGLKIGIIVNDVASINIDNKLLANPEVSSEGGTIELQNGCACCSLADELLDSVEKLMTSNKEGDVKREFDAIVVELSGVANPNAVRMNWEQATFAKHPACNYSRMDKVVTLVDSSTFGTDWMTWDTSGSREGWTDPNDCEANKKVPELLSEQIEAADVLVINKIDLAGEDQVKIASSLAKVLNDRASVYKTNYGEISVKQIFEAAKVDCSGDQEEKCTDPSCTDSSHDHSHDHNHGESCNEPACTDSRNDHSHSHDHEKSCNDPVCTDSTHDHSHSHDHGDACSDPGCTDPSHSHSHSHDHGTSTANLGITNFVYKRDRPFSTRRLSVSLNFWPVPIKEKLDIGEFTPPKINADSQEEQHNSPFAGVLRSKGFCWMGPTRWQAPADDVWRHNTIMYWSHAGKHFGISNAGKWWGTFTEDQLKYIFATNEKELDRILKEDFLSKEFGDRRQEIVFIGVNMDEEAISKELDECLMTDEEMEEYREQLRLYQGSITQSALNTGVPVKPVSPIDN